MIAISSRQRSLLLFLSAAGYTAWFAGLGEPLAAQGVAATSGPTFAYVPQAPPPRLTSVIRRDPFAGNDVGSTVPDATAPAASSSGDGASSARIDVPAGAERAAGDVPNIAGVAPPADVAVAGPPPADAAAPLVVRATIAGPHAVAYVASGATMEIVRVGDVLAGHRIARIDLRGLGFTDGSRLDLPGAFAPPAPAPARAGNPVLVRIDDLRRVLGVLRAPAAPAAPAAARPASAQPVPATAPPAAVPVTPAPLPTTDRRGLAPGVNPTPDLQDPTAFPYPYPYPAATPPHR